MTDRLDAYDKAIQRVVRCKISARKATTDSARYRANGALYAAGRAAITAWYQTSRGCQARVRYATTPHLLEMEAVSAIAADVRNLERSSDTNRLNGQQ